MALRVFILTICFQVTFGQTWILKPYNKNVTVGSNVRIPCETKSTAQYTIIWSKDSTPIFVNGLRGGGAPDRYTIEANNTLVIRNVQSSDEAQYTCNIFGFESGQMYLRVTAGSLSCLSCSSVDNSSVCKHSISCEMDEVCYTHQYMTDFGAERFDFGCSNEHSCSSLLSRRDGRHNLCSACCNSSDHCNRYSRCEGHETGTNRSCLSCTDVSPHDTCKNSTTCRQNEVCFTHHFITESGDDRYDFGCSNSQSCPSSSLQFVGKRADGRHSRCYACCNETDSCNRRTGCNNNYEGAKPIMRDCWGAKTIDINTVFPYPNTTIAVKVYCKLLPIGMMWTVIQRRINGSLNFTRDWISYKNGFGQVTGEFWLGNDVIHALTSNGQYELRIDMTDQNGTAYFAQYGNFMVDGATNNYRLHVNNYIGDAGDSLTYHDSQEFSTPDRDNDGYSLNCAASSKSGWWFKRCYYSDLNGMYNRNATYGDRLYWRTISGVLKTTTLMIRRKG